jgi:hypothetical protein
MFDVVVNEPAFSFFDCFGFGVEGGDGVENYVVVDFRD